MKWLLLLTTLFGYAWVVNSQRDNPRHNLPCSAFDGVTELPEGDIIEIRQVNDNCIRNATPPEISFQLSAGLIQVRRWKSVTLHRKDNNSDQKKVVQQQCGFALGCNTETRFNYTDLVNYGNVVLWKDELWPLRPYAAYNIQDALQCFRPGYKYIVDWIDDGWIPDWLPTLSPGETPAAEFYEEESADVDEAPEAGLYELDEDFAAGWL